MSSSDPLPTSGPRSSFSRRILGVLALVLAVALAGSALGVGSLSRVSAETERMVNQAMAAERLAGELQMRLSVNVARSKALALSSEPQVGEALAPEMAETSAAVQRLLARLRSTLAEPQDQRQLQAMAQANEEFIKALQELTQARDGGVTANIERVYSGRFMPAAQAVLQTVTQLGDSQRARIDIAAQQIESLSRSARWLLMVFGASALALGTVLSLWLVRAITGPIGEAVRTANRVAALDLSEPIEGHDRHEGGQLLHALSQMQMALHALVAQTQLASGSVAEGATEIAAGNLDFSNRTELSASFLQQTAAMAEQIAETMQHSMRTAADGAGLARSAVTQAQGGSATMVDLMHTMSAISEASRQIVEITAVIDGIAFQTNILALNAAVEAARAGEEGRGFAVVAAEVRALANRSGLAARQIKSLIGASVDKVGLGAAKAQQAHETMARIVDSVQKMATTIAEINADLQGQGERIQGINKAVGRLDQMTQQNAAVIEESSAAARVLQDRAGELRDMTGRFRLPLLSLA